MTSPIAKIPEVGTQLSNGVLYLIFTAVNRQGRVRENKVSSNTDNDNDRLFMATHLVRALGF